MSPFCSLLARHTRSRACLSTCHHSFLPFAAHFNSNSFSTSVSLHRKLSQEDINRANDQSKRTKEFYKRFVTIKSIHDIPEKYRKVCNDDIPDVGKFLLAPGPANEQLTQVTLREARRLAREHALDLVVVNTEHTHDEITDPDRKHSVHTLKLYNYDTELEHILDRLQDQEAEALLRKREMANRGKPMGFVERLNLRIDKAGCEMKAALAKKLFHKGKSVMFQIPTYTPEDDKVAVQKLQYVKDYIENNYADVARLTTDIDVYKKRAFVEFAPSEALLQEQREAEKARKQAAREKNKPNKERKVQPKRKHKKKRILETQDPFKGKSYKVADF